MSSEIVPGIKMIRHNASGINELDDPSMPFRLEAIFHPPAFMQVAFVLLHGNEEIIVRSKTREALERFVELNDLETHPRLIRLTISGPEK